MSEIICSVDIALPISTVVELFTDHSGFRNWQKELISHTSISGEPWQEGSTSGIVFLHNKRRIELTETILVNKLPAELNALYEHVHMSNIMTSRFESPGENLTRYTDEVAYVRINHIIPRLMFSLMPCMAKRQTQEMVDNLKQWAEEHPK